MISILGVNWQKIHDQYPGLSQSIITDSSDSQILHKVDESVNGTEDIEHFIEKYSVRLATAYITKHWYFPHPLFR